MAARVHRAGALTADVMPALERLTPLAPLHQPHNFAPIRALIARCGPSCRRSPASTPPSTARMPPVATRFALPREYEAEGVRRYGFHGLSYEYIARPAARDGAGPGRGARDRRASRQRRQPVRDARRAQRRHHDGLHRARRAGDGHPLRRARPRRHPLPAAAEGPDAPARSRTALPALGPARRLRLVERHARRCWRATTRARARRSSCSCSGSPARSARWPPRSAGSTARLHRRHRRARRRDPRRRLRRGCAGSASTLDAAANAAARAASPPDEPRRVRSSRPTRKRWSPATRPTAADRDANRAVNGERA